MLTTTGIASNKSKTAKYHKKMLLLSSILIFRRRDGG